MTHSGIIGFAWDLEKTVRHAGNAYSLTFDLGALIAQKPLDHTQDYRS
jgi:hypothetical protein